MQAGLSVCWVHMSEGMFTQAAVPFIWTFDRALFSVYSTTFYAFFM